MVKFDSSKLRLVYFPENDKDPVEKFLNVLSCLNAIWDVGLFSKVEATLTKKQIVEQAKTSLPSVHLTGKSS